MSNRTTNTIVVSCLLFASSAFFASPVFSTMGHANNTLLNETIASAMHQTYISEYNSYPSARRSDLTVQMLNIISEKN